jgi:hypothetical protein
MSILRYTIAYVTAPLAIPAIELRLWEPRPLYYEIYLLSLYCGIGFLGILLFGIPIYLFLQQRNWTDFWVAPIAGFIVAGLIWSLMEVALIALFGTRYFEFHAPSIGCTPSCGPTVLWAPSARACCGSWRGWNELEAKRKPMRASRGEGWTDQLTSSFSPSLSITLFQSAICAWTKPSNCSGAP